MADCEVQCITKPNPLSAHEHITHIGNPYANPPWKWPREQVIASIDGGTNSFYVVDPRSGKRSDVGVVRSPGRAPYLRTYADGDWNNNLLSLQQCPKSVQEMWALRDSLTTVCRWLLTSTEDGMLVAPRRWKHGYTTTYLDATGFPDGGVLHIEITLGDGPAEASFDVYSQGARLPSGGFPNSLAGAHDVKSGSTAKIDYRFDHGTTFRFGAEGSWNANAGDTNTYSIAVSVRDR